MMEVPPVQALDDSAFREKLDSGASVAGAMVLGADLRGCDFSGKDLSNCIFRQVDFRGCSFIGANLSQARFQRTLVEKANFSQCRFHRCMWDGVFADHAIFIEADLEGFLVTSLQSPVNEAHKAVVPVDADQLEDDVFDPLRKWGFCGFLVLPTRFRNADFSLARFTGSVIQGADFANAKLRNADCKKANFWRSRFHGDRCNWRNPR